MNIATIVFTYNRSWHTKQVLDALSQNYELPEKLFIFQDGMKKKEHAEEWKKVNSLIKKVDFCPVEIIVSEKNKGLAKSIMSGINYVIQNYDAIIVLEDDCVPSKNFIGFMNQALHRYENVQNVYSVTGYAYTDELNDRKYDAFFIGKPFSWGWGTWKNRWADFTPDPKDLSEILADENKSRQLSIWGNNLPQMMIDQRNGKNDSWAVYWALHVINRMGFCLVPHESLIKNIGMDGTGVHCGVTTDYEVRIENDNKREYSFPEIVAFNLEASSYYLRRYGGYTAFNVDTNKKHIIIYGLGNYFRRNEMYFCDNYYIECFIDRARNGYFAGKKIIQLDDLCKYSNCQIIILLIDINESKEISELLCKKYGIGKERISRIGITGISE